MPDIKLTARLQCIANLMDTGSRLADIGTDHGHLPLYLLQKGIISEAIGSDLREGPLSRAKENAESYGLGDRLSLRLAAGLEGIAAAECDVISIAGMGGETIAQILADACWTKNGGHKLLLQPMTRIPDLRQYLWANGYDIVSEHILREEHRWYIVLVAQGGASPQAEPRALTDCYTSPALLRDPLAKCYLEKLLQRELHVLQGMERGLSGGAQPVAQGRIVRNLQNALEDLT